MNFAQCWRTPTPTSRPGEHLASAFTDPRPAPRSLALIEALKRPDALVRQNAARLLVRLVPAPRAPCPSCPTP